MGERFSVAVVTDWQGTAGPAICNALIQAGFSVFINGPQDILFNLAPSSNAMGKVLAQPFDAASEKEVQETFMNCVNLLGAIDVLVNNNYFWNDAALKDISENMWDEVINRGIKSAFYCSRAASRFMKAQGFGKIINVISTSAYNGIYTQFAAGCAAIHSLTKSLARELAPEVRVNSVAPGLIDEPWIDESGKDFRAMLTKDILLNRLCTNDDIAEAVNYLACGADFMTGQMLVLDGGEALH
ncbi:SDR family oxidoreductase [bacterium]|nr:SDR family oxidoreductase [bacterium]